ncbi:MAG: PD-(D/E)XK nuclease family protein [Nanoarchaeota archaeon]
MAKRVQSPSSINMYKSCARKYYYIYVKGFSILPSIHLVRGNIAHSVLEHFYNEDLTGITKENYQQKLQAVMPGLLVKYWTNAKKELEELDLSQGQIQFFFEETLVMLFNWLNHFCEKVDKHPGDFPTAFKALTPKRELQYTSKEHSVRGFIDAIEHADDGVRIVDYKTSKEPVITPEYRLQLAIYSLMYQETHGELPKQVGIFFLKDGPQFINVDHDLIEMAKREIAIVHKGTETENIVDYPKAYDTKWCKYCEFAELCWGIKNGKLQQLAPPGSKVSKR